MSNPKESVSGNRQRGNNVGRILTKGLFFLFLDRTIAEIPATIAYKSQHGDQRSDNIKVRLGGINTGAHECPALFKGKSIKST